MNRQERYALRTKHSPLIQGVGGGKEIAYCEGCKGTNNVLITPYPCDALQTLETLEEIAKIAHDRVSSKITTDTAMIRINQILEITTKE
jgi:hypothetical protein